MNPPAGEVGPHREHGPTAHSGFTVVRVILGMLLIAAAGLKLFDHSPDSLDLMGLTVSPHWHTAVIEAEALLGIWLLTGAAPRLLWLAALLGFSLLAGVSLYLGIKGQPSCGCFGAKLTVNPWWALALDLAAVASLVWWRPPRGYRTGVPFSAMLRRALAVAVGSGAILAAVLGGLTWMYGSPGEALRHFRGESITVEPSVSQVGDGVVGDVRTFTVQLSNHRERPVAILGGTATSACTTANDLPIIVPPKESRSITVQIKFRGSTGRFRHSFVLYTDDEGQPTVTAWFVGRVIESVSP